MFRSKYLGRARLIPIMFLWTGAALAGAGAREAPTPSVAAGGLRACLSSLEGSGPTIACAYTTLLTEAERTDMRRLTRQLLQDATCRVSVRIDRALVTPALETPDHEFVSPPQPVACTIKTKDGSFDVTGTFAPKVTFKDGKATYATPGLGDVTGVSKVLAWPVIQYVNYSPGIRKEMLEIINSYKDRKAQ